MNPDLASLPPDRRDLGARLESIDQLKRQMEEQFHLYEEIRTLPTADRDALFQILWDAQSGDTSGLDALVDMIYDEVPVPMDEFVLGRRYLGFKHNIDPVKLDLLCKIDQPHLRKAWLAIGSGGGKGFMAGIIQAREVYQLLCLRRPDLFYMLSPGSRIATVNVSVSRTQSKDVVFTELNARLTHAPWFAGRFEGTAERIRFPKNVYAISGGKKATSFYGYHTKSGVIDEASWMREGEADLAEGLIEALLKSMHTRFPNAFKLVIISTLRGADDFLYRNVQRIKAEGIQVL